MATTTAEAVNVVREEKVVDDQLEAEPAVKEDRDEVIVQEKGTENGNGKEKEEEDEEVRMEVEPKTGVKFPVKVSDGKQLLAVGVRKKRIVALNLNIYGFGIYGDIDELKELLKSKFEKAPEEPTEELYSAVIDSDVSLTARLVIVFSGVTMSMVRKNFDEVLGVVITKLNGGQKDDELATRVLEHASDSIKLSSGSVIEITRLPGHTLQTKVKDEVISTVESELLSRAFFHLYLGANPFDKNAKEKFGASMLSLF